MTRSCNLWSRGPEVKLGTGNECYHIKYEKNLRNFVDFLPSAFFDSI